MIYDQFVNYSRTDGDQLYASCPFPSHSDSTPSFTVNSKTEQWFCHGCGFGGGAVQFLEHMYDVSSTTAKKAYDKWEQKGKLPFPTVSDIEKLEQALLSRPSEVKVLNEFGITDDMIKQAHLGFEDLRITIPVYSRTGMCVNIRKYLPPHRRISGESNTKIVQLTGLGETRFYPYEAFEKEAIYIVEGEKDTLVARSQGINAVTGTGGANIPSQEFFLFKDKVVYLMLDTDPTGYRLVKNYKQMLFGIASKIIEIKLPEKDFTDYWVKYQNINVEQFTVLETSQPTSTKYDEVDVTSLGRSEHVEHLNMWVKLEGMSVIGADPKTYTVPSKLKIVCKDVHCSRPCAVGLSRVPMEIDVDPRQLLQFVDANDSVQDSYVRKIFGCKSITAEPASFVNVQKILFQESASFLDGLDDGTFENRYGIFVYEENRLVPTVHYNFEACRVTDPRNQQNYYVIRKAEPVSNSYIGDMDVSIAYFQQLAEGVESAAVLLEKHYDIWKSALGIEGRPDLFGAIALTYLSCTEITWRNGILKGWLDTMVIGDTRTGKSQMAQRFVKTIRMGTYINGENARRTGIIGGVQKFGDSWVITWGAIPMNDKGLLLIDEASGLEIDDIKELSATRSSGAVTINKIAKGEARARTRLIWMSNPRSGRNLEDFYWKGYGAFVEFIPVVEDQARFDLVLTAAREDVETLEGIPNTPFLPTTQWADMITTMWSVPKEGIIITKEVDDAVVKCSKDLDKDYGGGPLVVGVAVHEKIIRLSVAFSGLRGQVFGGNVVLSETDVHMAEEFLRMTYDKKTMDYKGFMNEYKRSQRQRKENTVFIKALCATNPALKILLSSNMFRGGQVREILGIDQLEASKIISELLRRGLLRVTGSGAYSPDKILIDMAKEMNPDD